MAVCDSCQQDSAETFRCGRCRSVTYCSKDCQRSAWSQHKQDCKSAGDLNQAPKQMAVLLGEGFSVKAVEVEKGPVHIPVIRHHFDHHKQARDSSFKDVLLPVSDRLFGRAMRLVYDSSSRLESNRFANRDTCGLESGFGLEIRGQALLYDPAGKDINLGDFACFDDQVCNIVMSFFEDGNYNPTEAQLNTLRKRCQESYELERSMYRDSGSMIIPDEDA